MTYKWTQKDFKHFKARVLYWRRALGLLDWDFVVSFKEIDDHIGAWAQYDIHNRLVDIALNSRATDNAARPYDHSTLELWALHETLHVLLADMSYHMVHTDNKKTDSIEHQVIRCLENLILGDDK